MNKCSLSQGQTDLGAKGPTEQRTAGQSNCNQAAGGVLDFSSDSEEEGEAGTSRALTAANPDGAQGPAAGHGCLKESFTELFLQGLGPVDVRETSARLGDEASRDPEEDDWSPLDISDMELEEISKSPVAGTSRSPVHKKPEEMTRRTAERDVVPESDEDDRQVHYSEESESLLDPRPIPLKHPSRNDLGAGGKKVMRKQKTEDRIESFSSSDDDTEFGQGQLATPKRTSSGRVTFTTLKSKQLQQTSTSRARQGGGTSNVATIDALLGKESTVKKM